MMAFPIKGKYSIILILAAVLAGGAGWYFWSKREKEIQWRTAYVERGPVQISVTATGTLQAVVTVQVGTQVSGTVSALYVDFNSQVSKGQTIARIDTTLLRAALTDAMSNLEKVAAQERQASEELRRTQVLFDRTLISQADLDMSTANARVATANLNSARAQVDRARINLRYATIVSPIDGIVLSRAVDVGQTVAASFNTPTLFTIAGDLRQMQVQASVDEADIGKVKVGQKASFTVDAYPDTVFTGEVRQIRLQPVTVQNVVSYDVVIAVPNPELMLMPGMTANLTIAVARKEDVLQVPASALRFSPGPIGNRKDSRKNRPRPEAGLAGIAGESGDTALLSRHAHGEGDFAQGRTGCAARFQRGHGDGTSGGVYIMTGGKPTTLRVQSGLSDGAVTEISGPLQPGDQVVTGIDASTGGGKAAPASPFGIQRGGRSGGRQR